MEFLCSFLKRHFAGKPVVAPQNVGCFLATKQTEKGLDSDSSLWIPDSRYQSPVFVSRTWILIPIVGWIPDSLSCIPDSIIESFPYSGFHKRVHLFSYPNRFLWEPIAS